MFQGDRKMNAGQVTHLVVGVSILTILGFIGAIIILLSGVNVP